MFLGVASVFIPNSRAFIVADFIKENKIEGIKIVGYDLLKRNVEHLNNDVISFLINQNPEEQGFLGISHLYKKLVLKEEINTENYMPLEIIVKEKKAKAEQLNADSEAEIVFFSAEISLEKKIQYDIKESEYFIFMVLS